MTRATPPTFLAILRAALVQVRGDLRPAFVGAGIFTAFLPALLILWLSRLNLTGGPGTDSLTVAGFVGSWSCMIVIQVGAETYMDRVGGALLRVRVLPHGPMVWAIGKTISTAAILVVSQVILLVLGMFLLNGFPLGWGQLIPVVGLAIVASLAAAPIGFLSGAVARGSNLQMLSYVLVFALLGTSGAAIPLVTLPGWVQVIQQALPFYWSGPPDPLGARRRSGLGGGWFVPAASGLLCVDRLGSRGLPGCRGPGASRFPQGEHR